MERKQSSKNMLRNLRVDDSNTEFGFGMTLTPLEEQRIRREIENRLIDGMNIPKVFHLDDLLPFVKQGVELVVHDDFSKCFESNPPDPWNWNTYLYILWLVGVIVRYFILFPLRILILMFGFGFLFLSFALVKNCIKDKHKRAAWERFLIRLQCSIFVFSWTGVIRYHGVVPARKPNRIYVANHTSMIDVIVLQQNNTYSLVGQKHPGWVGYLQGNILSSLGCVWFDRGSARDRNTTLELIKAHIANPDSNRLLVFPEGTCVNNNYCVQFKRGVFSLEAEVCPIAIKYNMIFCDAFWNSRAQSFAMYLIRLMCSWAVVCDVYYLEPQKIQPGESDIDFSNRVKKLIADRAGLQNVQWDGYLKHFRPSAHYVQKRQKVFAEALLKPLSLEEQFQSELHPESPTKSPSSSSSSKRPPPSPHSTSRGDGEDSPSQIDRSTHSQSTPSPSHSPSHSPAHSPAHSSRTPSPFQQRTPLTAFPLPLSLPLEDKTASKKGESEATTKSGPASPSTALLLDNSQLEIVPLSPQEEEEAMKRRQAGQNQNQSRS